MVFSSLEFIFWFLPVFLILLYITPSRFKNYTLLAGSLFFYAYGEPAYLGLMILSILVNYALSFTMTKAITVRGSRLVLVLALIFDFGMLFIFKYYDFFITNLNNCLGYAQLPLLKLTLPLGISFYTFQITSYMIDLYRGRYAVEKNVVKFATYISMFPQLIAGPIVNYSEVRNELDGRKVELSSIEKGTELFIIGLCYKVLLANNIASLWNDIDTIGPYGINTALAWFASWGYSMQLYFDFFGYSLMAIGLGRMIGFRFPKNFNNPYMAVSLTDFWRRWHMTLSRWFKDYIYIPLGGSRCGHVRNTFNLLVVWLFTGLWHGADWNFLIWGLCTFVLLVLERAWLHKVFDRFHIIGHLYMLVLIPLLWTIFNISDLDFLVLYLKKMFFIPLNGYVPAHAMKTFIFMVKKYIWIFAACVVCATPYPMRLYKSFRKSWACKAVLFVLFWWCAYELVFGTNNPFLYFRF